MADPLSITASLIAVAQISGSIISLCYDYRRGIQDAHKDVVRILREVQFLRNVIEQLLQLLDKDDDGTEVRLSSLKNMNVNDGPFAQCQDAMVVGFKSIDEILSQQRLVVLGFLLLYAVSAAT